MTTTAAPDTPARLAAGTLKLYEATAALETVRYWLEESEGELTPAIEALLAQADGDFDAKVERVALFIREREGVAAAVKAEKDRLAAREAAERRTVAGLKGYLLRHLEAAGRARVEGTLVTVRVQKNSAASVSTTLIPDALGALAALGSPFVKLIPSTFALDTPAVLAAWKAGAAIPDGVTVVEGVHVRIA